MSELAQDLIEALEKEDIRIEPQSDGGYIALWPSRYGGTDEATGRPILWDSATCPSLIVVICTAIHEQKSNMYWRGKKDALDEAMTSLHTIVAAIDEEGPITSDESLSLSENHRKTP